MGRAFLIDNEQFFMYKKDGAWHAHDRYCFVKPVPPDNSYIFKPSSEEPLMGIMKYPNQYLIDNGINEGMQFLSRLNQSMSFWWTMKNFTGFMTTKLLSPYEL